MITKQDVREFIESPGFTQLVRTGKISDTTLKQLQIDIINGYGEIIPETGGYQKIRCGGEGRGKRGGWRVVFADYPAYQVSVIVFAYPKNTKENLTRIEQQQLKKTKQSLDREVRDRYESKNKTEK